MCRMARPTVRARSCPAQGAAHLGQRTPPRVRPGADHGAMPFAEELIGPQVATTLCHAIQAVAPGGSLRALPHVAGALDGLPLRERADLLRDALLADVPGDHRALADVVRAARDASPEFGGWLIWPVTSAVASRAVQRGSDEDFADAMALLAELTSRLTSEFAVRELLRHDLDLALESVQRWTGSPDEHVRRLGQRGHSPLAALGHACPGAALAPWHHRADPRCAVRG